MEVKEIAESFIDLYKDRVEEDKLSPKNQREVPEYQYDCLELANAYIDLLAKQEGMVLVPEEPTNDMYIDFTYAQRTYGFVAAYKTLFAKEKQ